MWKKQITIELQRKFALIKQIKVIATKRLQHICIENEQYLLRNWTFYKQ